MQARRSRRPALGATLLASLALGLAAPCASHADDTTTGDGALTPAQLAERIDAVIAAKLADAKLKPAPKINDVGFLRRLSLDVRGAPPTPEEIIAFSKDKRPDKRAREIVKMLADVGYSEHWADIWNSALVGRSTVARRFVSGQFEGWVEQQLAANLPYDAMVRDILTAEGWTDENGAAAYALRYEVNPMDMASTSARQFLGIQIQCAQCHDHPYTDYTQKDFLGMAAYFGRTGQRRERVMTEPSPRRPKKGNAKGKAKANPRRFGIFDRKRGTLKVNANMEAVKARDWGRAVSPSFIVKGLEGRPGKNFRENYAQLVTNPGNTYFSQMAVNRVWSVLFGMGFVNPVEDLEQGESLHPELLAELGAAFVKSRYDLKWLIEAVLLTDTYQRSSRLSKSQEDPDKLAKRALKSSNEERRQKAAMRAALERSLFARAELRPLSPEQLLRSVANATGLNSFIAGRAGARQRMRQVLRQFTFTFDNGEEDQVGEFNGTIPQALLLMNSAFVNRALESPQAGVAQLLRRYRSTRERLQRLSLMVLSRLPDKGELALYERFIKASGGDTKAYHDLAWVLMNSSEFVFQN
jgi:hypothetical protein